MNSKLNVPARVTVFAVLTLLVIAAALTLSSSGPVFGQSSPPGAPTGLRAVVVNGTTVELYWTAPTNTGGTDIIRYKIQQSGDGRTNWGDATATGLTTGNTPDDKAYYSIDDNGANALSAGTAAHFRVRAINASGNGAPSNTVRAVPTPGTPGTDYPAAPTNLVADANGPAEIKLAWTAIPAANTGGADITGYMIEYSDTADSTDTATTPVAALPWKELATTSNGDTEYSDTSSSLMPDTKRWYRVSAINADGERSVVSATAADTTTPEGVPAAPTGLRAVVVAGPDTDTSIELYWKKPTNTGGGPVTAYNLETLDTTTNAWTTVGTDDKNIYRADETDLAAGVKRSYRVSAMNGVDKGLVSATVVVEMPSAGKQPTMPEGLTAVAQGTSRINLQWTRVSGIRYVVEYSETDDGASPPVATLPWKELTTTSSNSANHTGLKPSTTRYYRVSAINDKGRSLASDVANATTADSTTAPSVPGAPTGLRAVVVNSTTVELYWTAPTNTGGADLLRYQIEILGDHDSAPATPDTWGTGNGGVPDTEDTAGQNAAASGVQPYYSVTATAGEKTYRVRAETSAGVGAPSNTVKVTPTPDSGYPAALANLVADPNGPAEVKLAWTAPTGDAATGGAKITGYMIEYTEKENADGDAPALPWKVLAANTGNDKTEYSDTSSSLMPATKRWYRVSAINADGERGPVPTAAADLASATTTPDGVPAAPTDFRAVVVGTNDANDVELYWKAPTNTGGGPITVYNIETLDTATNVWSSTGITPDTPDKNTYRIDTTELTATGKRSYRVSAQNGVGKGLVSATVTVERPGARRPAPPSNLSAVAGSPTSISLLWAAPSTGASPTGYVVEYAEKAGTDNDLTTSPPTPVGALPWKELTTTSSDSNTAAHMELNPETERWYRVSAINDKGRSYPSNTAYAKTLMGSADTPGEVTLSTQAPVAGMAITASLMDPDGMSNEVWKWQKSTDKYDWDDITGATSKTYTPDKADVDYYLRAMVTYDDENRFDLTAYSEATESAVVLPDNRMGSVSLSPQEPLVGEAVTATLSDADGMSNESWKWQKSMDKSDWDDITGAATAMYTPEMADVGYYLRAMVTYDDKYREGQEATSDPTTSMVVANNQPTFADGMGARKVAENSAAGTNVGDPVMATDADTDDMLTYALGGYDMDSFAINTSTGQITVGEGTMLDYEAEKMTYMVTVTATDDSEAPNSSASIEVTISVTNMNEAPYFADETATREVAENTAADMAIGDAFGEAMDPDADDTLTYSLGGDDADSFGFDAEMRQIKTMAALDYETKSSYSVMVIATDGGELTDSIDVTINVTDVDEGPELSAESYSASVAENSAAGTDVDVSPAISATSADSEATLTFSLSGDGSDNFAIDGGAVTVAEGASLDYETTTSYSLTVTVSDGTLSDTATLTIMVTNVDESGTLTLPSMRPVVGTMLTGMLDEGDDEGVVDWQWSRSTATGEDATFDHIAAESMSYTPTADDVGYYLQLSAMYDDGHGSKTLTATTSSKVVTVLMAKYDTDPENGKIDRNEAIAALQDYRDGDLTRSEAIEVLRLYRSD